MEGHVRRRGDKWYYSFEAASVDGKRKRIERVGGRTKKEAEAALRTAVQNYENTGLHFEPAEISVSDYMDYWFTNYVRLNCKYNTQEAYRNIIKKHIKPALGIYRLKSLTPAILQEFINEKFTAKYSKPHLTNIKHVLSTALQYAVHPCKFIIANPMTDVNFPKYKLDPSSPNPFDNETFSKIIERFPVDSDFYILLMIGYYIGCRIGEATALTWDDVDFKTGTIRIDKILHIRTGVGWCLASPKNESSVRSVKIGKRLMFVLQQYKKHQTANRLRYGQQYIQQYERVEMINGERILRIHSKPLSAEVSPDMQPINFICTRENGKVVTSGSFKYCTEVLRKMGIEFNFHSLRHLHATILIEHDAPIKAVQARLGHARIETTLNTYTHATDKMASKIVDIFEQAAASDSDDLPTKK